MRLIGLLAAGAAGAAGAAALAMSVALPATAADTADTTVTFGVTGGLLAITAPASVNIGSGAPGTTIANSFGVVTVSDLRGDNPSLWTATVSSTSFTSSGVPAIPTGAVTYTPGLVTVVAGDGSFTAGTAGTLATARVAVTHADGTGSNNATWNPLLAIAVPITATVATYTGTVTHLVA